MNKPYFNSAEQEFIKLSDWISSFFSRRATANNCMSYIKAIFCSVERRNCWQLSEASGKNNPYVFQHLLNRSQWDHNLIRDELSKKIFEFLGANDSVIAIDETGFIKKGKDSAGVAPQYTGTVGKIENCQIGVFLSYSTPKGHTLIDRRLYIPKEWFEDKKRLRKAGINEDAVFHTKIEQAQEMLQQAYDNNGKPEWVTADSVYGDNGKLRIWLEKNKQCYVMSVKANHKAILEFEYFTIKELFEDNNVKWQTLSSGNGTKGRRKYRWSMRKICHPNENELFRFALCRQSLKDPSDRTYYLAYAPDSVSLQKLVSIAGRRWTIEECFKTAKSQAGLDEYEVRTETAWYKHITLSITAQAMLLMTKVNLNLNPVNRSKMSSFKKKRGLMPRLA